MKIEKCTIYYVEWGDDRHNEYRRNGPGNWERAYGNSWELHWDDAEIEAEFQRKIAEDALA